MAYQEALTVLSDPTRRAVFEGLRDGPVAAGILAQRFPVSRPAISQHLKVLRDAGLSVETRRVEGQPDTALKQLVEAERFDMLVMGAYGHSRIRSLMIGSTTTQMIRSCKVPLLLFR